MDVVVSCAMDHSVFSEVRFFVQSAHGVGEFVGKSVEKNMEKILTFEQKCLKFLTSS